MRPSSGGSRRISKRVLPSCALAAISTARPASGTATPVGAVVCRAAKSHVAPQPDAGLGMRAAGRGRAVRRAFALGAAGSGPRLGGLRVVRRRRCAVRRMRARARLVRRLGRGLVGGRCRDGIGFVRGRSEPAPWRFCVSAGSTVSGRRGGGAAADAAGLGGEASPSSRIRRLRCGRRVAPRLVRTSLSASTTGAAAGAARIDRGHRCDRQAPRLRRPESPRSRPLESAPERSARGAGSRPAGTAGSKRGHGPASRCRRRPPRVLRCRPHPARGFDRARLSMHAAVAASSAPTRTGMASADRGASASPSSARRRAWGARPPRPAAARTAWRSRPARRGRPAGRLWTRSRRTGGGSRTRHDAGRKPSQTAATAKQSASGGPSWRC